MILSGKVYCNLFFIPFLEHILINQTVGRERKRADREAPVRAGRKGSLGFRGETQARAAAITMEEVDFISNRLAQVSGGQDLMAGHAEVLAR
jgi:hypothetical protein